MKRALVILLLLVSSWTNAEETAGAPPAVPNITVNVQQPAPPPANSGRAQILTDGFFNDVGKPPSGPANSKSPYSGTVRTMASESDSNSGQREQWLATCDQYRGKDSKAYRDCFDGERKKSAESLRQSREAVERRQGLPLRNSQSVPDLESAGEPAFGGAEVEAREEKD